MSDLLSLGSSGIRTYQKALSTVSNNIANLNTEGYSRQVAEAEETAPKSIVGGYLGTGSSIATVRRQYDAFLEQSLRSANSDLGAEEQVVKYAEHVVDLLGGESVGLDNALDQFFATAKELASDPGSTVLRNIFLRDADVVAGRFRELHGLITGIGQESKSEFFTEVDQLNALATQLATVNRMMLANVDVSKQPPKLLDQRDQILRDMADITDVNVRTNDAGRVVVSLTNSFNKGVLVNFQTANEATAQLPDSEPGVVRLVIEKADGGSDEISGLYRGSLGGISQFRSNVLSPVLADFNALATQFAGALNAIQTTGLNGRGEFGEQLFEIEPQFTIARPSASQGFDVDIESTPNYEGLSSSVAVTFDETLGVWTSVDPSSGQKVFQNADGVIEFDGLHVLVSGTSRQGDSFEISASSQPAATIQMVLSDPLGIAAASAFRVTSNPNNLGSSEPVVSYVAIESPMGEPSIDEVFSNSLLAETSITSSLTSLASVLPAETDGASFVISSSYDDPVSLHLLTRDGVHLVGDSLTEGQQAALMSSDMGFNASAQYSSVYRNQTGTNSYRDLDIFVGIKAEPMVDRLDSYSYDSVTDTRTPIVIESSRPAQIRGTTLPTIQASDLDDGEIIPAGSLTLNGYELDALTLDDSSISLRPQDVISWMNSQAQDRGIDVTASAVQALTVETRSLDLSSTLVINGIVVNTQEDSSDVSLSTDATEFSMLQTGLVAEGGYSVTVNQLASSQTTVSSGFASQYSQINDGNPFMLGVALDSDNSKSFIEVEPTTPAGVVAAINNSGLGISASLINTEEGVTPWVIELEGESGADNAFTITDDGVGLNFATQGIDGFIQAQDASVDVNGVTYTGETNSIEDAVPGITLSLSNATGIEQTITVSGDNPLSQFEDIDDLVYRINEVTSVTGVEAHLDSLGDLILTGIDHPEVPIEISSFDSGPNPFRTTDFDISSSIRLTSSDPALSIELGLTASGQAKHLAALGFNTEVHLGKSVGEDLLMFFGGTGSAASAAVISAEFGDASGQAEVNVLRHGELEFEFVSETEFTITDTGTNTVMATRAIPNDGVVLYRGLRLELDPMPTTGDRFVVNGNLAADDGTFDAQGNNVNMTRIVELEFNQNALGTGQTIGETYRSLFSLAGDRANQAAVSRDALIVIQEQAVEARDAVSGVNLDQEAADLIRFQQAYQASAQVIQAAQTLFDRILQIR